MEGGKEGRETERERGETEMEREMDGGKGGGSPVSVFGAALIDLALISFS